jgi:hypothetical protein
MFFWNGMMFGCSKCLFGGNTVCTVCFINRVESALNNRDIVRARLLLFADEFVANSVYLIIFLQISLSPYPSFSTDLHRFWLQ